MLLVVALLLLAVAPSAFAADPTITVTAPAPGSYDQGSALGVAWTTNVPTAAGEFAVWIDTGSGWYVGKLVAADGSAAYQTNVTLNLPTGTGYHVVVGYRETPGVGAFTTFAVGEAFDVAAGFGITVTAPAPGSYDQGSALGVAWTTNVPTAAGEFAVWIDTGSGWYVGKLVAADGSAAYQTNVTLNLPTGTGYHVVVGYRETPGVGAFTTFAVGEAFDVAAGFGITVTAPAPGSYDQGSALGVAWTTNVPTAAGEFAVWIDTGSGWYVGKLVAADGSAAYQTNVTLNLPTGTGYHVVVGYRETPGVGAFTTFAVGEAFDVAAGFGITVTAPAPGSYDQGSALGVAWTTNVPTAAGEFAVWIDTGSGWYVGKLVAADGSAAYQTNVTLNLPTGTGYHVVVGYRETPGVGAFTTFAVGEAFDVAAGFGITVTAPAPGSYDQGSALGVAWTTNVPTAAGEFAVWIDTGSGWYVGKLVAADGSAAYQTNVTLNLPTGTGYHVVVGYRETPGVGAFTTFAVGEAFDVAAKDLDVTAPDGGELIGFGTQRQISWRLKTPASVGYFDVWVFGSKGSTQLNLGNPIAVDPAETDYSFTWTVTQARATDWRVRVYYRDEHGASVFTDFSQNTFSIVTPELDVTAPDGGDHLVVGATSDVTWTLPEALAVGSFDLEAVSPTQGSHQLASGIAAQAGKTDYSFAWTVKEPLGADYTLRLIYRDAATPPQEVTHADSGVFAIVAPQLTLTSPLEGASLTFGAQTEVIWTVDHALSAGSFDLVAESGLAVNAAPIAVDPAKTSYSFAWAPTLALGGGHTLHLVYKDAAGQERASSTPPVSFSVVAPTVTVTAPLAGARLDFGVATSVTWTVDHALSAGTFDLVASSQTLGLEYPLNAEPIAADPGTTTYSYSWTVAQLPAADYQIKVIYFDEGAQEIAFGESELFTILEPPTPAPTIAALSPTGGQVGGGAQVVITGTGFTGATAVTFGGTNAASFVVDSDTRITATTPAKPAGTYQVQVTGPGGSSADVPADDFTYYEDLSEVGNAVVASPASTSIAITPGFTIQSGDLVVAMINVNVANRALTDANGNSPFHRDWTRQSLDGATYHVLHRVAGANEPATYRWNLVGTAQTSLVMIRVFRGADTSAVYDVSPAAVTEGYLPNSATITTNAITTASDGSIAVALFLTDSGSGERYSAPTGGFGAALQAAPNSYRVGASYTKRITTAGAVAPVSATLSGANDGMGLLFAIKQAAPTPPPGEPHAWGVASVGDYTYLADGAAGLRIYDVSDPDAPTLVGSYDTPGEARDVAVVGGYAYVADGSAGVQVIDVVDPAMPRLVGSCPTAEPALHITLSRGTLYDDFESATDWTASGGTVALDTGKVKHGASSLKLTAPAGGTATASEPVSWDLSTTSSGLQFWVYAHAPTTAPSGSFTGRIRVRLYTAAGSSRYFESIQGDLTRDSNTTIHEGWNLLRLVPDEWRAMGGAAWSQAVQRVEFAVTAPSASTLEVSLDEFRGGVRGARAAFLWNFDDGYDNVYTNGFPYLQARGQKATMYLNGDLVGAADPDNITLPHLQALYDAGWVIGNHTIDHTDLATVSQEVATQKVEEGYQWLEDHGFTRGARHFAYPSFSFSDSAVAAVRDAGMLTARIDSERNQQLPLDDPFRLTCIEPRNGYDYEFFYREVDRAIASGSTVSFLLHTVQPADGLQDLAGYLDERGVWCPNIDEWYKTMVAQAETTPWVGRYAYVTTGDGGVQTVDIGDPAAPTVVGGYDTSGSAAGVDVKDGIALVADGGSGLEAVDMTDTSNPVSAGSFDTTGSAKGVAVGGGLAYVSDGAEGLQIVDVTDSASMSPVGGVDTPGDARAVAVWGGRAYVADGASGVQVIGVGDPASPSILGAKTLPGEAEDIVVHGDYMYVAAGDGGLRVLPVALPPSTPTPTPTPTSTPDPGQAYDFAAVGKYGYLAAGPAGLKIYDISDPDAPALVGTWDTPGSARDVSVVGDYAYIADESSGLQVVGVADPAHPAGVSSLTLPGTAEHLTMSTGRPLEDFESTTGWTRTGGTISADTANVKHGSAALKVATPAGTTQRFMKSDLGWDLSRDKGDIQLWVYLHSTGAPAGSDAPLALRVYFSNANDDTDTFYTRYNTTMHEGWNLMRFTAADMLTTGSPSWNTPIQRLIVSVTAPGERGYELTFDDMRAGVTGIEPAFLWTFDDGYEENYEEVLPYLAPRGIKATMYLIADWPDGGGSKITFRHLQELYDAGWAIGNHTVDHTVLTDVDQGEATQKIVDGYQWLMDNGFTRAARHFAYPLNYTNAGARAALAQAGVLTARIGNPRGHQSPMDDALQLSSYAFDDKVPSVPEWLARIDRVVASGGTFILSGHQFDSTTLPVFQGMVDYLVSRHVWMPTIDEWYDTAVAQSATAAGFAGRYAYVACGASGLQVVDLTDPLDPRLVGTAAAAGSSRDVETVDTRVYAADGTAGLQVIDATQPATPAVVGASASGGANGLCVRGGLAYLAEGAAGLRIVNVTSASSPTTVGACDTPGDARDVVVLGDYAYVADGSAGIQIISVADPAHPSLVGSRALSGQAEALVVFGGSAYVALADGGLQIVNVATP